MSSSNLVRLGGGLASAAAGVLLVVGHILNLGGDPDYGTVLGASLVIHRPRGPRLRPSGTLRRSGRAERSAGEPGDDTERGRHDARLRGHLRRDRWSLRRGRGRRVRGGRYGRALRVGRAGVLRRADRVRHCDDAGGRVTSLGGPAIDRRRCSVRSGQLRGAGCADRLRCWGIDHLRRVGVVRIDAAVRAERWRVVTAIRAWARSFFVRDL